MPKTRNGVPAGWTWRDGRPRWIPSPGLRKAGWKGKDLKDGRDQWLSRGASIDAAAAIVRAVADWKAGELTPADLASIAPAGSTLTPRPSDAVDPFSLGALIDAYLSSDELTKKKDGTPRPPKTVADYRNKLKRLVDTLAGYADWPADQAQGHRLRADPDYQAKVARVRAWSVFTLEPVEGRDGLIDPLRIAYWKLHEAAGKHMAFGVLACASAWLAWCRRIKSRRIHNWAEEVDRETPPGRVRPWTFAELAAIVAAADTLAMPEIGDAAVLAVDLAWSEIDLLNLTWAQIAEEKGRLVAHGARQKTGRVGGTPLLSLGRRRVAAIQARQRAMDAQPLKVIHLTRERQHKGRKPEADSELFRKRFALVRAEAAKHCPSCAEITFADTRDTGFTLGRQAGLNDDGIASRTRQSRANIKTLGDRHYGEIGPEIAAQAADLLDAYLEGELKKHKVNL